jgi:GDP-4-dehydro-6-deoxy-D-mannose reductase
MTEGKSVMHGKTVLITGVTGFIGRHLALFLTRYYPTCQVIGVGREQPQASSPGVFYSVDLVHPHEVEEVVHHAKPDYVFHLAGLVYSYDWSDLFNGNIIPTVNLFEAIKKTKIKTHLIIAGSSAEYGVVPFDQLPVVESCSPSPQTPYGMIKLWKTMLGKQYDHCAEMSVTTARLFNVIGYGASRQLTTGDLFFQLLEISQKKQDPSLFVGNVQIKRDFLDIDDVCAGLIAIATQGKQGELYNVCSGSSVMLKDILDLAIGVLGVDVELIIDQNKSQNTYVKDMYGCNMKLKHDTTWQKRITLEASVRKALTVSV